MIKNVVAGVGGSENTWGLDMERDQSLILLVVAVCNVLVVGWESMHHCETVIRILGRVVSGSL